MPELIENPISANPAVPATDRIDYVGVAEVLERFRIRQGVGYSNLPSHALLAETPDMIAGLPREEMRELVAGHFAAVMRISAGNNQSAGNQVDIG